eukprot:3503979-Alexandrium_andersonii.AAC.1
MASSVTGGKTRQAWAASRMPSEAPRVARSATQGSGSPAAPSHACTSSPTHANAAADRKSTSTTGSGPTPRNTRSLARNSSTHS